MCKTCLQSLSGRPNNPQNTKEVLEFVIHKVEHFKEFEDKKEYEKMMYEHRVKELYAEYMSE